MKAIWSAVILSILVAMSMSVRSDEKADEAAPTKETKCPLIVPVTVEADSKLKAKDVAMKNDAPTRVTNFIACELEKSKVAKPFKLEVTIVDFRIRSGAAAFWVGAMAGADRMALGVKVQPASGEPSEFRVDTTTIQGGVIKPDPRQRINHMAKDLARKIASQLTANGYIQP